MKKYLLSFIPLLLFAWYPFFRTGWPLILIAPISVITVGIYIAKSYIATAASLLELFVSTMILALSYVITLLFIFEIGLKLGIEMIIPSILCALIGLAVLRKTFIMTVKFIKNEPIN